MRIAMFTNTYLPHVGGVAHSVKTLADACWAEGHEVLIIAPEFKGADVSPDVVRVPAIQNFNGSDFSLRLPFPNTVREAIDHFAPDLIHSHHPFLLGDTALREAWKQQVPVVFTHHTLYERYTHYVPLDSPALKRFAIQLATEYGNLCDLVIAPSHSIAELLRGRGVTCPLETIPTGVDTAFFASGDRAAFRAQHNIPAYARVIGHVGRLAPEKNLRLLAEAVAPSLAADPSTVFLLVGEGGALPGMLAILTQSAAPEQIHCLGKLTGRALADAYAAMDCFVFTSQSETQGLVLAEAMAASLPIAALDGPGVREIVRDGHNGLLLPAAATASELSNALHRLLHEPSLSRQLGLQAKRDAAPFSTSHCVAKVLGCYAALAAAHLPRVDPDVTPWDRLLNGIGIEWDLFVEKMSAAAAAVSDAPPDLA